MIEAVCPRCGRKHLSDEAHAGKFLRCAECGDPVQIPGKIVGNSAEIERPIQYTVDARKVKHPSQRFDRLSVLLRKPGVRIAVVCVFLLLLLWWGERSWQKILDSNDPPPRTHSMADLVPADQPPQTTATPPGAAVLPDYGAIFDEKGKCSVNPSVPTAELGFAKRFCEIANQQLRSHPAGHFANLPDNVPEVQRAYVPTHANNERLDNGSETHGHSKFDIGNHNNVDALIIMVNKFTGAVAAKLYLRRQSDGQIRNINPGLYDVRVTQGLDWDDDRSEFKTYPEYSRFPTPIAFDEHDDGTKISFDHVSVTLHTVPNGNIKRVPMSKADFWPNGIPQHIR